MTIAAPDPLAEGREAFTSSAAWAGALFDRFGAYIASLTWRDVAINTGVSVVLSLVMLGLLWFVAWLAGRRRNGEARAQPRVPAPLALTLAGFVLVVLWVHGLLRIWGLDFVRLLAGASADRYTSLVVSFTVTGLFALGLWEASSRVISHAILREADKAGEPRRAAQLRSIAPLAGGAVRTLVAIFALLLIVSQFGVEVAPLLAGAGVVSVAIGFGAQTIVKDYLTGFSLILEDIVAVGDIVRIGDSSGVVERMTLRTIRLRDFDGTLHVIPYSEAQTVHNMTKTFSYYVFDLSIAYESDIDTALRVMEETGKALQTDERFAPLILSPIEVYGVDKLAESGVVLKARIRTNPAQQWTVGREYNRRIKVAFEKAGVEIPFPQMQVTVRSAEGDPK